MKIYLIQVVEAVTEDCNESRFKLCGEFLNFMGIDEDLLVLRIQGMENPHTTVEHLQDSMKMIVFCAVCNKIYDPTNWNYLHRYTSELVNGSV
jgi:hypothetical protein